MFANFVNSILTFIVIGIFGSSHSSVFLEKSRSILCILGGLPWWGSYGCGRGGLLRGCFSSIFLILFLIV